MTTHHQNGGRAVGAGTSDLRNPPAIQKPQGTELIPFMRRYGIAPAGGMQFILDGVLRRYRIDGDPATVERGVYVAHLRGWGTHVVAFGLESGGILHVWPPGLSQKQKDAAQSVSNCQLKQHQSPRVRQEVLYG